LVGGRHCSSLGAAGGRLPLLLSGVVPEAEVLVQLARLAKAVRMTDPSINPFLVEDDDEGDNPFVVTPSASGSGAEVASTREAHITVSAE
jgi:hypothetical protein